jgi:hypothetical protein
MPLLEVKALYPPPPGLLAEAVHAVAESLGIDTSRVSLLWDVVPIGRFQHSSWSDAAGPSETAPIILFNCRETHSPVAVRRAIDDLKNLLESRLPCRKDTFIAVRRIRNDEVHAYGKLWE